MCPIGKQFLLSSFREFIHDFYCLATLAQLVHQACACKGNFYFLLSWPETKELPMSRKNVWDAISRSNWIFPREYFVFENSQCIVNNRKFKMRWRWESQINNSLTRQNTTLQVHHTFLYISLPSTARLPVNMHNFTFCEGRKQAVTKFILFMNLDMVDGNPAPEEFACIWQSKRVRIITIWTMQCFCGCQSSWHKNTL